MYQQLVKSVNLTVSEHLDSCLRWPGRIQMTDCELVLCAFVRIYSTVYCDIVPKAKEVDWDGVTVHGRRPSSAAIYKARFIQ